MPTPILTGRIAVFGVNGSVTITGTGLLASTDILNQSMSLKRTTQRAVAKDGNGKVISRAHYGGESKLTVRFIPHDPADPGNLANLKAKIKMPDPGALVTIAGSESPDIDGTWNFTGDGGIDPNQEDYLEMVLELDRVGETGNAPASLDVTP